MPKYRNNLPQLYSGGHFLTDGGIETTLIYREGLKLPHFAHFLCCKIIKGERLFRGTIERMLQSRQVIKQDIFWRVPLASQP